MDGQTRVSDIRGMLATNGFAAGWSLFAALVGVVTVAIVGLGLVSGLVPLAIVMVAVSVALSTVRTKIGGLSPLMIWIVAVAVSWALSAPLGTWMWNAVERADSSISLNGPQNFIPELWLWALIPAAVYLAVGMIRFRRR